MARKKERPNPTGVEITCIAKSRNHARLSSVAFPYRGTMALSEKIAQRLVCVNSKS